VSSEALDGHDVELGLEEVHYLVDVEKHVHSTCPSFWLNASGMRGCRFPTGKPQTRASDLRVAEIADGRCEKKLQAGFRSQIIGVDFTVERAPTSIAPPVLTTATTTAIVHPSHGR
jgi:hypothetical protein